MGEQRLVDGQPILLSVSALDRVFRVLGQTDFDWFCACTGGRTVTAFKGSEPDADHLTGQQLSSPSFARRFLHMVADSTAASPLCRPQALRHRQPPATIAGVLVVLHAGCALPST